MARQLGIQNEDKNLILTTAFGVSSGTRWNTSSGGSEIGPIVFTRLTEGNRSNGDSGSFVGAERVDEE